MTTRWDDIKHPIPNGWVKYFSDGTIEIGRDDDDLASWTKGRQDKMIGVSMHHGDTSIYLMTEDSQPGRFWQSDDYEVLFGEANPVRITRRIERKLGPSLWKITEIDLITNHIKEYTSKHKI